MRIQMLRVRVLQDAGVERTLNVGDIYDLPEIVAYSLLATGAARITNGGTCDQVVPETKPLIVPETKERHRRP